jgi:tRNA A-37 threonylcarbamoyl transferase component Bud32
MAMKPTDTPINEVPIEPGETFHGLLVQKLVARGGMGVVYRARQPKTGRDVALKILPRSLALEEEFRLRFDREARALAGLSHPNIVNLIDYGVDGDLMFLVMEFVEGVSLRQALRDKTLTPARSLKIALDLCEALQFAHREGVIHRDVKPENVLVDRDGRVKLTDFGLAKRVDTDSTQLTQTNLVVGTPHYMAPEQLEQPKGIDHRVDIYSLGVLIYEMLARELPIGRFPAPSQKAGVDPRLDEIIYRCLEKDPDRRYGTIAELKAALAAVAGTARTGHVPDGASTLPAPTPARGSGNLEVVCPCGSTFRVPAAARGLVHCPSCGEPVTLKLPTPGTARATAPARGFNPAASRKLIVAGVALLILAGGLLYLVLSPSPARHDGSPVEVSYVPPKSLPARLPPRDSAPVAPVQTSPTETTPAKELTAPAELRRLIDAAVTRANMAGIVSTVLLYSGRPSEHEQLQRQIGQIEGEIKEGLLQLEEQGLVQEAPDRFRPGDRIASFADRKVELTRTVAFADDLRAWLRAFRPGTTEKVTVTRNRALVPLMFRFPERTPELVALAHQAGIVLGETPGYVPLSTEPKPSPLAPFPVATVAEVRKRLDALPAFYRGAIPYEDRGRAEALLLAGQGSSDDTLFLTGRYSELLRKCEAEQRMFAAKIRELEAGLAEPSAPIDTILFRDGHKIEGTIIEETEETFKVKGTLGTIPVERAKVLRIERGKGPVGEFRKNYEAAKGRKIELLKALAFAKEKNLANPKDLAAYAILALDPSDERCRMEVGLPRTPFAATVELDPLLSPDRVEYRGRMYTLEQLRQELKSLGYAQVNGLWCEKIPRVFKVDNLYRDEVRLPATFQGASVMAQIQSEKDTVYDYRTKAWIPRTKLVSVARYIGGSGTCLIEIDAPGDIIDCSVHARAQVPRIGGYVSVSVAIDPKDGGKLLYTLSAPGENNGSHDVTEKVAGRNRFYIRADVRGEGMFLPSDSNDLSVFEVKYSYGKPLEKVNALFASKREAAEAVGDVKSNNDSVEAGSRNVASTAAQSSSLTDALAEMRKQTEGMLYLRDFVMPSRFSDVAAQLKDPLFPDWNGLTRDQALKLGSWWGLLPQDDRREFLAAYGVWCARSRYLRGSR